MTIATDLERYMLGLINAARADAGLNALRLELNLNASTDSHSQWMTDADIFNHTGAGGSSPADRMRAADMDLSGAWGTAENIAAVSVLGTDSYIDEVDRLHTNLMNSPGHRANILDPNLHYIGLGIAFGPLTYDNNGVPLRLDSVLVSQNFARTGGRADLDLAGGTGNDSLVGESGDDHIDGRGGNDTLTGGTGNDTLRGGDGTDTAVLGVTRAQATVTAITGGIQISSAEGTDSLYDVETVRFSDQSLAVSTLLGGSGPMAVTGTDASELFTGSAFNDTIDAGRGQDTVEAGAGNDGVWGFGGDDTLRGGLGNDTLRGGRENDLLEGGDDNDLLLGQRHGDTLQGGLGDDILKGGGGSDALYGDDGFDFLKGGTFRDTIQGGAGDDTLLGNRHDDLLEGGLGHDTLNAGGDNDTLQGGDGNDSMHGGAGHDTFVFATGDDADLIDDFRTSDDILQLGVGQSAADIVAAAQITTAGVLLDFGAGDTILLEGLSSTTGLEDAINIF